LERKSCFYSGLGTDPGLFLYGQRDVLVDHLVALSVAIGERDYEAVATQAQALVRLIQTNHHFSVRSPPDDWQGALKGWVMGAAFHTILVGNARNRRRCQAFVQEGLVFKLVWAVEAVRVQAIASRHPRASELGEGPALVFTYGVPTLQAALLCRMGFSSRTGAQWAVERLDSQFRDAAEMEGWVALNRGVLDEPSFWPNAATYRMWQAVPASRRPEERRTWRRYRSTVSVEWIDFAPKDGTRVRLVPNAGGAVDVCGDNLRPLGRADLQPIDIASEHAVGYARSDGRIDLVRLGPCEGGN